MLSNLFSTSFIIVIDPISFIHLIDGKWNQTNQISTIYPLSRNVSLVALRLMIVLVVTDYRLMLIVDHVIRRIFHYY